MPIYYLCTFNLASLSDAEAVESDSLDSGVEIVLGSCDDGTCTDTSPLHAS